MESLCVVSETCRFRWSGPRPGKSLFRCCNLEVKMTAVGFVLTFAANGMFYLSPDYNKRCFVPAGSRSRSPHLFVQGGVLRLINSFMCEGDNSVGRCVSTAGCFSKLTVVVISCNCQCMEH